MTKKLASKITKELVDDSHVKDQNLNREEFSDSWKGRVFIFSPEKSEIAQKLNIKSKGEFAIKSR